VKEVERFLSPMCDVGHTHQRTGQSCEAGVGYEEDSEAIRRRRDTAQRIWIVREERPHSCSLRSLSGWSLRCPSRPYVKGRARQWP